MATHDYVIANGTGAAVRSDLNDALAAIVSNNSGTSEPSTTYAYQWWADTTANVLKIRNSANNAWITLRELDGTMLIEDGSASAPGLAFASDLNTGFFRSAADKINFATGGAERLEIGSSEVVFNDPSNDVDFRVESNGNANMLFVDAGNDRVGIGTASPDRFVHIQKGDAGSAVSDSNTALMVENSAHAIIQMASPNTFSNRILFGDPQDADVGRLTYDHTNDSFLIHTNASERLRLDSDGRLLVGLSTARVTGSGFTAAHQVEGGGTVSAASLTITSNRSTDDLGARLNFARSKGGSVGSNTVVDDNAELGGIYFWGADGTDTNSQGAEIIAEVDGTPGSNDMPTRLVFGTTADGASSTTERVRIDSSGSVGIGTTSPVKQLQVGAHGSSSEGTIALASTTSGTCSILMGDGGTGTDVYRGYVQYNHSADAMLFATSASERMRLDSAGRLFLGNTAGMNGGLLCVGSGQGSNSPSGDHIKVGPNANRIEFLDTNSNSSDSASISFWNTVYNNRSADITFYHPGANVGGIQFQTHDGTSLLERMRIDNVGVTFINTTSNPGSARLSIGENFTSRNGLSIKNTGTQGGGQYYALFYNSSDSLAGSISHNGSTTVAFNTSSDYRLKENITSVVDGITRLQQLKPSRFNFIADPNKTVDGFIAHEVQTVIPEAITGDKDAVDDEGNPIYQGIDQSKLVPLLTAALQEAIAKIETLETKVAALEAA